MELKDKLQDYTRAEFERFVENIADVKGALSEHNQWVSHFDRLVKHPKGADLLFYPDAQSLLTGSFGAGEILFVIKKWHNDNGQLAFSDDTLSPVRQKPGGVRPSAEDRAQAASAEKRVKTKKVIRQIEEAQQNVESGFSHLDALLNTEQAQPSGNRERYISLEKQLSSIEAALHAVVLGVQRFDFLDMTVRFAKDDATRSLSYAHLDRSIQSSILQQISVAGDQYTTQKAAFAARYRALHVRVQAVMQVLEEQLIRLSSAAGVGPLKDASVLMATTQDIDVLPRILTTNQEVSSAIERARLGLVRAIRSAVSGLAWEAISSGGQQAARHASVMSFQVDKPGCGEQFAISVPLSELIATEGRDWQHFAQTNAEIDLPFRMNSGVAKKLHGKLTYGLKEITELTHVYVVPTDGKRIASKVKVRAAIFEADSGAYRLARPGLPEAEVLWMSRSASSMDGTSSSKRVIPSYIGSDKVPVVEAIPAIEDLNFDDCIAVFPYESGIEPVYLMFKGSREFAGVATGAGQPVGGDWLQDATKVEGAPIPSSVADQLRSNVFKRFTFFREAFWKGVASSPELAAQFSAEDLVAMSEGRAPSIQMKSGKLQIRYVVSPEDGGDVYDMDNMRIVALGGI